jgi:hypothetical protein
VECLRDSRGAGCGRPTSTESSATPSTRGPKRALIEGGAIQATGFRYVGEVDDERF